MRSVLRATAIAAALVLFPIAASAEEQATPADPPAKAQAPERVFGWELMTAEELAQHRAQMRSAGNREAREQMRLEHHMQMLERAEERGVQLMGPRAPAGRGRGGPPGRR